MKESEFIELLNLYLDHEISPADVVRLETEVARDPARRKTYQEYCRMQKACTLLADKFADEAPAGKNILAFEAPRRSTATWVYATGLAAAACFAVVVIVRDRNQPSAEALTQGSALTVAEKVTQIDLPKTDASVDRPFVHTVSVQPRRADLQTAFSTRGAVPFGATGDNLVPVRFSFADATTQFEWMNNLQSAPVQRVSAESLIFESNPTLSTDPRTRRGINNPVQSAAFEFRK